jgi:uncharacterized protein (TIGR03437 family)
MLTLFRLAPARFTTFIVFACFFALGTFDTLNAQSLTVSPSTLSFTAPQGGNPASLQSVTVGSTGGNLNYIISINANWISASTGDFGGTGGNAPDTLTVQVNSISLSNGSYTGTITLTPANGTAAASIPVSLTVSGSGTTTSFLSATPQQLSFGYELKQAGPPTQTSQITSNGISLPLSAFTNVAPTSNCPAGWLQQVLSSTTTPATLTISIVTAGLQPGSCTGSVQVSSNTPLNGSTTIGIGVTLYISSGSLLNVSVPPGLQSVTLQKGGQPVQFNLGFTSSDPTTPVSFTLTPTSTDGFLAVSSCVPPAQCVTPASVDVEIFPGATLAVGTYTGQILITSPGLLNNVSTIPVSLTITSASTVTVSPSGTQNFNELQGGSLPSPITLTLTGAAAQSPTFTTTVIQGSGGAWLQVSPTNGQMTATPQSSSGTVTLNVAPNSLGQGTYSSQAVITFGNSAIPQIVIPVSLTVQPPSAALTVAPSALTFSYQAGGTVPAAQTISITNPATGSLPFSVASISDSWLAVTPTGGNTPGSLSVSVSPQSLQPGSYNASFTLTAPGVANTTVSVALFISASTTPQPFIISNSASGVGGQLSPGEIITIKGSGLGPGNAVSFTVGSLTSPVLAGVQVTFNGFSGTLLYVSSTQINVTVPYEIAGSASAAIIVTFQGVSSSPISQPVGAASLGLYTDNSTGSGQSAALNPNSSCAQPPCYNTAATPVTQGSYVSVYGTGGGQTVPASTDGEVTPGLSNLVFAQYVSATIGGKAAPILFAGAAPGAVTGLVQFNIQVPTGVTGSALPIIIMISGPASSTSQSTATVAVQ